MPRLRPKIKAYSREKKNGNKAKEENKIHGKETQHVRQKKKKNFNAKKCPVLG